MNILKPVPISWQCLFQGTTSQGETWPPAAGHKCHFTHGEVIWHLQDSSLCDRQQPPLYNYSYAEWPWVKASGRKSVCGIWWQLMGTQSLTSLSCGNGFEKEKLQGWEGWKCHMLRRRAGCASRAGLGSPCSCASPCTNCWMQLGTESWPWKLRLIISICPVLID